MECVKSDDHDPLRCQASHADMGQCTYLSMEGMDPVKYAGIKNCPQHGGQRAATLKERKDSKVYRLQVWQQRVDEFMETNKHRDLREEISMVRLLIESMFTQCRTSQDLMMYSHRIGVLMLQLEKLITSCERLEKNSNMHMDKTAALALANKVVEVISEHIDDPEKIDAISGGIITILAEITKSCEV